jgi:hypothetical protein
VVGLQSELIFQKDDGTELRGVVFNIETILLALDDSVASTDTNIIDSNLGLMSTSKFKFGLLRSHRQQMDIPRSILIQRHGFKKNVVTRSLRRNFISLINNLVDNRSDLESVWVHLLADFALESLPVETPDVLVLSTWWLLLLLSENPRLEALEMDKTHRSSALACDNQWVGLIVLVAPADTALDLILRSVVDVLGTFHLHSFTELLLVQFLFRHVDVVASEVLHSESNTTKLDGIEFFDFVVIFAILVFQGSSD